MDIAFFYVDHGREWWRGAVDRMIATARATQPGCRMVHLGDAHTKQWPGTDDALLADGRIGAERMMACKGFMWAQQAMKAERDTLLIDADVEFQRDMAPLFAGDWDVGLLWRETGSAAIAQPYLACMALTKPTEGARRFWQRYGDAVGNLPKAWHAWWVDQVAFSVVLGTAHKRGDAVVTPEFRVKLFDADVLAPKRGDGYVVHHKGNKAEKMA